MEQSALHSVINREAPPPVVQHTADHDRQLHKVVAEHLQKVNPFSSKDQLVPAATQSIKKSQQMHQVGAVMPDEEPPLSHHASDLRHHITTSPALFFGQDPDTYDRNVKGKQGWRTLAGRLLKIRDGKAA